MIARRRTAVTAQRGEKWIQVVLRFNTEGMTADKDKIVPCHALDEGWVTLDNNESHRLRGQKKKSFHSLAEIPAAVENVLMQAGVRIHRGRKTKRYVETD